MEEYFSADRLLELAIGSVVQTSSQTQDNQFIVNLVGIEQGKAVITTLPATHNLPEHASYETLFTKGMVLEMRIIHHGTIIAFESGVLAIEQGYSQLLITSYPEMVETRRLRKDTRFPCTLSTDIMLGVTHTYGVIINISNGGCLLNLAGDIDPQIIEEAKKLEQPFELEVFFPFSDNSVTLMAVAKSVTILSERKVEVGLAFSQEYEVIRKYLDSLQLESVAPFFE